MRRAPSRPARGAARCVPGCTPVISRDAVDGLIGEDRDPPAEYLTEATEIVSRVGNTLPPARIGRIVERFVTAPPPTAKRVLCHNDLGAEHLLAAPDHETLTGIIDWSDAARAAFYTRRALLEHLDHGLSTGDHRYNAAAVDRLEPAFAGTA